MVMYTKLVEAKIKFVLQETQAKLGYPRDLNVGDKYTTAKNVLLHMFLSDDDKFKELIENCNFKEAKFYFMENIIPYLEKLPASFFDNFSSGENKFWASPITMAMDVFPFLELNIFNFPNLPAAAEVSKVFDTSFALRHGSARSGRGFILDQAKKYFNLRTDAEAIVFIIYELEKGKDIFKGMIKSAKAEIVNEYGSVKNFFAKH